MGGKVVNVNQANIKKPNWPVRVYVAVATIFVVGMFSLQSSKIPIFDLRFNPFALLSLTAVVINLAFFLMARRMKLKSDEAIWFTMLVSVVTLFSLAEMFQRLSANPEAATFWAQLQTITSGFNAVSFFLFALFYVSSRSKHVIVAATALVMATLVFFFGVATNLIFLNIPSEMNHFPWGWQNDVGAGFIFVAIWAMSLMISAVVMLVRFSRRAPNNIIGKQARLFAIAIGVLIVGGIITDVLLPTLGLNSSYSYQGIFLTVATCTMMYGLYRYHVFQVSPATISQDIFDTMSEAVVAINRSKLGIEYLNNAAEKLFHTQSSTATAHTLFDLLGKEYEERIKQALGSVSKTDSTQEVDDVAYVHSDQTVHLKIAVAPLDKSTGIDGYVLAISDVTELKESYAALQKEKESVDQKVELRTRQLAHAQARLLASIGSLQQGFVMTDADFKVVTSNDRLRQILSITSKKQALEVTDFDIAVAPRKRLADQIKQSFQHSKPMVFSNVSFEAQFLNIFISPIVQDNETIGNVVLIGDVTEEHIMQRSKDEFFSIASHELRTPLTVIKGNISLILSFYEKILNKEQDLKKMLMDIHHSSASLIDIVSDFLDLSRLEQGKAVYQKEAFSLDKVIETVLYETKTMVQEKKLSIKTDTKTLDSLPLIMADQTRTKQILYNLVGNALKFTEKGGVEISAKKEDQFVCVTVSDSGRGISPKNQKLLFHKFQQAGESLLTRDTTRGTGLGLYISKMLTENMGGTIKLDHSEEGKGSSFSFTLPIAKPGTKPTEELKPETKIDAATGLSVATAATDKPGVEPEATKK